ncbi:MAG TPA: hypothetical protein VN922_17455 [Bacteroidia bacterium]|nr:hypothetical protein [Bacteroidia bacterium]
MKKYTLIATLALSIAGLSNSAKAQSTSFSKGSFLISVTEGSSWANYSTQTYGAATGEGSGHIIGCRDPLTLEYGISNHFGIGITSGTDFYYINPNQYYGFETSNGQIKAFTKEFTVDLNYHFFVTRHFDLSGVVSYGGSTVSFSGNNGFYTNTDTYRSNDIMANGSSNYNYNTKGGIFRAGFHGRAYIGRFGFVAMITAFTETGTPQMPKNAPGIHYATTVSGLAKEFGFCFRIGK